MRRATHFCTMCFKFNTQEKGKCGGEEIMEQAVAEKMTGNLVENTF